MDIDHQKVVFEEGDPRIARRFAQMGGAHVFHNGSSDSSNDRVINFIVKMSGGHIKSKKVATIIGLFLMAAMFIISIIWFIKALSGPKVS